MSLIAQVFLKLLTPRDVLVSIHNSACFWKAYCSERVNESQTLLQYAETNFYPTFWSFRAKLSYKRLFLIRSEILGLLDNTLTDNYEYSHINRGNLPLQNEAELSQKASIFCYIFFCIFEVRIKFPMFWKKNEPHSSSISEVIDSERCACLNS